MSVEQTAAKFQAVQKIMANTPEKTLWDEYAMAALTGILARKDGYVQRDEIDDAIWVADQMMGLRKDRT